MFTLEQVEFLLSAQGENALQLSLPADQLRAIAKLRKTLTPQQAAAVFELQKVRKKALAKFDPSWAKKILASDLNIQQASSSRLANAIANRFAIIPRDAKIFEICSGLGADAIALGRICKKVTAVDASPAVALCAQHNIAQANLSSRVKIVCALAEDFISPELLAGNFVHADPDRRATGKRSASLSDYAPSEEILRQLITKSAGGAIKLSPATDPESLADLPGVKLQYVSEDWTCKQLLLWWGELAKDLPAKSALVVSGEINSPQTLELSAGFERAEVTPLARYIIEADPAIIAADALDSLAGIIGATRIDSQIAWLTADEILQNVACKFYEVLASVPGRLGDIKKTLTDLDAGIVAVKPRGLKLDTDTLQKKLRRKKGTENLAVFWGKFGKTQRAIIARAV